MSYDRAAYYQEAFEIALEDEGLGHLLEQITAEQRANIGGALEGAADNVGMAFYTPENPLISENDTLKRKLRWERELTGCHECGGNGRLSYRAGPWWSNTECHVCSGDGKVHPRGERCPA